MIPSMGNIMKFIWLVFYVETSFVYLNIWGKVYQYYYGFYFIMDICAENCLRWSFKFCQ